MAQPGEAGRREKVDVLTLDELWRQNTIERLDFIKCNVKGSEMQVIQGGLEVIRSQHPGWPLEISRKASYQVFCLLKEFGYRAFGYDEKLIATENYRDKEFSNYFFLHPQAKISPSIN